MHTSKNIKKHRLFTIYATSFLFGLALSSIFSLNKEYLSILIFVSFFAIFCAFFNKILKNHLLVLFSFAIFFATIGALFYANSNNPQIPQNETNQKLTLEITTKPEIDYKNQKIYTKILTASDSNLQNSLIYLKIAPFPKYQAGDILTLSGDISPITGRNYLKSKNIFMTLNNPTDIKIIGQSTKISTKIKKYLYLANTAFSDSLKKLLPEPASALAAGLIVGERADFQKSFEEDLSRAGLTHIIALSGYNITIIISALSILLLPRIGRRRLLIVGGTLIFAFVIMTGGAASVTRAAILSLLLLFGKTLGRSADQTNLLLLTCLIMILINPNLLVFDIGFQLSFLAFCGIVYLSKPLNYLINKIKFLPKDTTANSVLSETLSAQLLTLPVILFYFGTLSLVAPLSNLFVLWIIPMAMLLSFISAIFGLIYFPIAKFFALIAWVPLWYISKIVKISASLPFSAFEVKNLPLITAFFVACLVVFISVVKTYKPKTSSIL